MYLSITNVKALKDYKLLLKFENDEERIFDITPYLEIGKFQELKDEQLFKTVRVSFDTIEWDNGLDLDPELLYEKSKSIAVSFDES
jgi:hypothetical protein